RQGIPRPHGVGDELHLTGVALQRFEGGAVRRVEREGGQKLAPGLPLPAPGERLAALVETLGHPLIDPGLYRAQRRTRLGVVRRDREHDLPLLRRAPELAVTLEGLRLLAVARGQPPGGPPPGWRCRGASGSRAIGADPAPGSLEPPPSDAQPPSARPSAA